MSFRGCPIPIQALVNRLERTSKSKESEEGVLTRINSCTDLQGKLSSAARVAAARQGKAIAQDPEAETGETCTLCASPPQPTERYRCRNCEYARYCSTECLETDEDAHSMVCETLFKSQVLHHTLHPYERRSGPTLVRGLIFEATAEKPRFAWVAVKNDKPIGLREYLGTTPIEAKFLSLCKDEARNIVRNRRIRDEVKIYTQSPHQRLQENNSIRQVLGTCRRWLEAEAHAKAQEPAERQEESGEASLNKHTIICSCISSGNRLQKTIVNGIEMHSWKGNVAFMMSRKTENNGRSFRDADSTDFRDIVDFLSVCQGHQPSDENHARLEERARKFKIVNVFTIPQERDLAHNEYLVPKDHPLVRDQGIKEDWGTILPISQHIELPMYAVQQEKYLRSPSVDPPQLDRQLGWKALMLRSLIDPRERPANPSPYGAPVSEKSRWAAGYGNISHIGVVLIRADQKDLRDLDMQRLNKWIMIHVLSRLKIRVRNWLRHRKSHPKFWTNRKYARLQITKMSYHKFWHTQEEDSLIELPRLVGINGLGRVKADDFYPCPYHL